MSINDIFLLSHILVFTYWLGGDLASYHLARFTSEQDISQQASRAVSRMGRFFDLFPRLCMPLTLATGVTVAVLGQYADFPIFVVGAVWPICFIWVFLVLLQHFNDTLPLMVSQVSKLDMLLRLIVLVFVIGLGGHALWGEVFKAPAWIGIKTFLFAGAMLLGMGVRLVMRPFPAALERVQAGTGSDKDRDIIKHTATRARRMVMMVWLLLIGAAAVGIAKPV